MKKNWFLIGFIAFLSLSSFMTNLQWSATIKGIVVNEDGKPIAGVLVYATEGEEEALTTKNGEFSIETSRNTPFMLTAEHWEYQKGTVTVRDPGKRITIKLTRKKKE